MTKPPVYRVEDRSILLPYYRRWIVDPFLPLLPAKLNPNTITHVGHLANLAGVALLVALWPERGWPFAAAAALLHFYMWCDNADGAHARRTNQCSALGEFLDHGLDQLNTVYIAFLTCLALGAAPSWWVGLSLLIPGAACVTYWEQSETGVFRLGLLNQVESVTVLSLALGTSAIFGTSVFDRVAIGPVSLRLVMCLWPASTILFGMARGMVRVASQLSPAKVLPIIPFLLFGAAVFAAHTAGAIDTVVAVTLASGVNVYYGTLMLSRRLRGEPVRVELELLAGGAALAALAAWTAAGHAPSTELGRIIAAFGVVVFGVLTANATRRSLKRLAEVERTAASS